MTRARRLTDKGVAALLPKAKRYVLPDPEMRGHWIRVQPSGAKAFVAMARDPYRKQIWHTIGATDLLTIAAAREQAREAIRRIKAGKPPVEPPPVKPETFKAVSEQWLRRHVTAKGLRTADQIRATLDRLVWPVWGERDFVSICRSDVSRLLDDIEDRSGATMADRTLAVIRSIARWHAVRHDDYVPPFVVGMGRAANRARERTLSDDEIRAVWKAAEKAGRFGGIVRLALLTAQRRATTASLRWSDIVDGVWHIPAEPRAKGTGGALPLPPAALAVIHEQPRLDAYVFPNYRRRDRPYSSWGQGKAEFDAALPPMPGGPWRLHDLRRSSRSLMSRAAVEPHVAERVLGHVVGTGVQQIYDRHKFTVEKGDALRKLAALIASIVDPPSGNVVALKPKRKARRDA